MAARDGEPMKMGDLTELYRVEKKSKLLNEVRPDLYPALAALLKSQNDEYLRLLSEDPESILLEGINQRRKAGRDTSKKLIDLRMEKICNMAQRGAMGGDNSITNLTKEEKEYYDVVLEASERLRRTIDRINGQKNGRMTRLVEEPEPAAEPPEEKWVAKPEPAPEKAVEKPAEREAPAAVKAPERPAPKAEEPVREAVPEPPKSDVPAPQREEELPPLPPEDSDDMDEEYETQIPDDELDSMIPDEDPMPMRDAPPKAPAAPRAPEPEQEADPLEGKDLELVRILKDMPTISGPEHDYTLGTEDVVLMPKVLAEVMVNRGMGVRLNPSRRLASLSCGCRRGTPDSRA